MSAPKDRRTSNHQKLLDVPKIINTLMKNKLLWIAPTVAFTLLGFIHALTKSSDWEAVQTLMVRDEAVAEMGFSNSSGPLGRFESNDSLKRFLETVLQVAKNREVARAALEQVGPVKGKRKNYPTDRQVESLMDDVEVSAPKGSEFGTSEVIYLSVTADDPQRAVKLTSAVVGELENRMRTIRETYAGSIIGELQQKKDLAQEDLEEATERLSKLEGSIGQDLGEMRTLAEPGAGGEGNLRTQLNQLKAEMRQIENQQSTQDELLSLLKTFQNDSKVILATPNRLLESQPALRRLKDGLVDAQLRTARLRGGLTEEHPRIQASLQNEKSIETQLFREVENAMGGIGSDRKLSIALANGLQKKLENVRQRLDTLAGQRAPYVNLVSEVNQCLEQVRVARVSLAEARGRQEASMTSSLITRLDEPVTGSSPKGPGRFVILLGSSLAGLLLGLSLVYLLAPWQERARGRRKSDSNRGRRQADTTARKSAVPNAPPSPSTESRDESIAQPSPTAVAPPSAPTTTVGQSRVSQPAVAPIVPTAAPIDSSAPITPPTAGQQQT